MQNIIVAIDGPAGAGKSTITKIISTKCHLVNIDTGAMYRCVALKVLENNISLDDQDKIEDLVSNINIDFDHNGNCFLDGKDVSKEIRSKEVTEIVSPVSNNIKVREKLVLLQQQMASGKDVVMEGRDIGTVVFPNANYKFYLDASVEERATRRFKEYQEKHIEMSYEEILENIKKRDYNDMHKPFGALKRAKDAIYIDSSKMTINEVANLMIENIEVGRSDKNES